MAGDSYYIEKGEIYIESSADAGDVAVKIPTTLPHSILTITPKKDPDADGNSVVGTWDFILKDAAINSTDSKYWRFSDSLMPLQVDGYHPTHLILYKNNISVWDGYIIINERSSGTVGLGCENTGASFTTQYLYFDNLYVLAND